LAQAFLAEAIGGEYTSFCFLWHGIGTIVFSANHLRDSALFGHDWQ